MTLGNCYEASWSIHRRTLPHEHVFFASVLSTDAHFPTTWSLSECMEGYKVRLAYEYAFLCNLPNLPLSNEFVSLLEIFCWPQQFVWQLIRGVGILHCNLHLMRFSGCLRGVQCCVTCISIRLPYYLHGSNHSILVLYWIIAWRDHKARS